MRRKSQPPQIQPEMPPALNQRAEEEADFETGRRFYHENSESLLQTYQGKYIAIVGNQVVDSDASIHDLATRVYTKYGYRDIFMPKVVRDRVIRMPLVRRVR